MTRPPFLSVALASIGLTLAACGDGGGPGGTADTLFGEDTIATVDTTPPGPVCGDGRVEGTEVCDEGDLNGTYDHCADTCLGAGLHCGDGVVQTDREVCDDGPVNGHYGHCGYGCNGPAIRCGNGFIEAEYEACDDGEEKNGTYGHCASDCQGQAQGCGDGHIDVPVESCDDGPDNGTPGHCAIDCNPVPGCGDGVRVDPEVCDDGLDNGTYDHCAADCAGDGPGCGDGVVQKPEACDDGLLNGTYGHCLGTCTGPGPRCGDGTVQTGENCDDGADNGVAGHCAVDCLAPDSPWIIPPGQLHEGLDPTGAACSDDDLLAKYMRYRTRLRGTGSAADPGFVVIGTGPGCSMPASRREPTVNCKGHWSFTECPREDFADARGKYNWGDGTVWLGEYIAVLALEYGLFRDLGLDTAETLSDLQLSLLAFDRLDERAETFFGVPSVRDGFFLRDDVPDDFNILPGGGYRWPRADGYAGYECVSGDLGCDPPAVEDGSYVSQDQAIALMWGMALVAKLVPSDVVVNGVALHDDAREKIHRMVWFMRKNGWRIKDPTGASPPDAWGGNAIGFSDAMAKLANVVCGSDFGVDDYRNFASKTLGEASWTGLQAIWEPTHAYNRTHALRLAAVNGVWDGAKMTRMAQGDGKDYLAVTWAILHDATLPAPWSDWRMEALLRSAPCSGPCRGVPGCSNSPGWMSESRVNGAGDRIGSRHFPQAEFNGMDYMGMFAAYHLYKRGHWLPVVPAAPPTGCAASAGILGIAAAGAPDGATYDPTSACAAGDMAVTFCRRPWAGWLEDAYRGRVTIFAGGGRWECTPGQPCKVVHDGKKNTDGDDLILGTPGADTLGGGSGNDCVIGFAGDDELEGNQGYDELWGMEGNDRLSGESANWVIVDGEADVLFGGPGNDQLEGNPGKDELYGEDGDDELDGSAGDDFLMGGPGNDRMRGGAGEDALDGGEGDDKMIGDGAGDQMWGGPGRDALDGEAGDDSLDGGPGDDFLRGGDGDDTLITGDDWELMLFGHDRACGNGGDDVIWGGWDGDECLGGGWFLGGQDSVNGCDDGSASTGDCDNGAFEDW